VGANATIWPRARTVCCHGTKTNPTGINKNQTISIKPIQRDTAGVRVFLRVDKPVLELKTGMAPMRTIMMPSLQRV
jgi:hypothetical protein